MDKKEEAKSRLKYAIIQIATELNFDPALTRACIEELSKDELITKFTELKDLRLQKENDRLIGLLIN